MPLHDASGSDAVAGQAHGELPAGEVVGPGPWHAIDGVKRTAIHPSRDLAQVPPRCEGRLLPRHVCLNQHMLVQALVGQLRPLCVGPGLVAGWGRDAADAQSPFALVEGCDGDGGVDDGSLHKRVQGPIVGQYPIFVDARVHTASLMLSFSIVRISTDAMQPFRPYELAIVAHS